MDKMEAENIIPVGDEELEIIKEVGKKCQAKAEAMSEVSEVSVMPEVIEVIDIEDVEEPVGPDTVVEPLSAEEPTLQNEIVLDIVEPVIPTEKPQLIEAENKACFSGKEKSVLLDLPINKKLSLRPRKQPENAESSKDKNKTAVKKTKANKTAGDAVVTGVSGPPILVSVTESVLMCAPECGFPPVLPVESTQKVHSTQQAEYKPSSNLAEMPMLSSENNNSIRVINSESETRISSTSDNSNPAKVLKKKRKRKRMHVVRKKDRRKHRKKKLPNSNGKVEGGSDLTISTADDGTNSGQTSPSLSDLSIAKKRKCSGDESGDQMHKKSREFAVPSPSLADINMKAAIPESTALYTEPKVHRSILCLCRKRPQVYVSGNNLAKDLYCQALDSIDHRVVGCCNPIPSRDVALHRPSEKANFQMLCSVHQQRLLRHNCCPGCGLFCLQGRFLMCSAMHHYHRACYLDDNEVGYCICPHCGDDAIPKSVVICLQDATPTKDPIFLPQQRPPRVSKPAKMSISHGVLCPDADLEPETITLPALPLLHNLHQDLPLSGDKYTYKNLQSAAVTGDVEKLLRIIACGLNVNKVLEDGPKCEGQTPLHVAAASGHLPFVHMLLQAHAQLDLLDAEQNSPLTLAIMAGHNDVVKYLVRCGSSLIVKSEDGMTPLHLAAKNGNPGACLHILSSKGLPVRYIDAVDDGGWTAMVWAAEFNHVEVVQLLIDKGSNPLLRDTEQNIALHWAAFGGSLEIVELFLNYGSDINVVNVHGDTPLHIAARQDKYHCVLLLLARGAKSDMRNKSGELALDCCEAPECDMYRGISLNMEMNSLLTRFRHRSPRVMSNDISLGKERNQIQCVNAVDDESEPQDYLYVSDSCFTSKITVDRTITSLQHCSCRDTCTTTTCNCAAISIQCWYDHEGRLKPEFSYSEPPMIFECNPACRCNRITCTNRVVQNGITCRVQLFRTETKGWGIKTLSHIPRGTYVCEYIGEIISDSEADHREDDSYLFDLDNRDGETYCIDARKYGNFARFINHMCVPNLMPVHVFVEHQDLRFPRIAFFANRDIAPNEELGYNYGAKFWVIKWKSFTCSCGADKCMYSAKTIKATLDNYTKKVQQLDVAA